VYAFFLIVFLCCCVFVVKQLLNNWMGGMAGLAAWPDWPPGSATVCQRNSEVLLCLAAVVSFFFFHRVISELSRLIATQTFPHARRKCDGRNWVRNFGCFSPIKFGAQKHENSHPILDNFQTSTANNFGRERDVVSRKSALKTADTPPWRFHGPLTKSYWP